MRTLSLTFQLGIALSFSLTPVRTFRQTGVLSKGSMFNGFIPNLLFFWNGMIQNYATIEAC